MRPMEPPEGFEPIDAQVFKKGDDLLVVVPELSLALTVRLATAPPEEEDPGPPPPGYEWTGEVRPPKKGELFWSDLRGRVIEAIEDETGTNRFGEPTGGRRLLRPVAVPKRPARPAFRIVKDDE